ncbi:uncharacterized protein LOC135195835 isoform X2 [Macrobrachium nipponense]|uniref:uncharacterized protein LOC135195835 isoform X2 n=1 Tax=Macrobrachium nipponense TaxID=159736 RepID=UPI0030C800E5
MAGLLLQQVRGICLNVDGNQDYQSVQLPNGQQMWFCSDPTKAFSNMSRVHISSCNGVGYINSGQNCTAVDGEFTKTCVGDPLYTPLNVEEVGAGLLPEYVRAYKCPDGMFLMSGARIWYSQCIRGIWIGLFDACLEKCEDCPYPRDCSEVTSLGFNTSREFTISPTGRKGIRVWCQLSDDPDNNGWTQVIGDDVSQILLSYEYTWVAPSLFFIGIDNLAALTWSLDDQYELIPRPQVIKFMIKLYSDPNLYHATYDEFLINSDDNYNLLSVGNYHGNAGDALRKYIGGTLKQEPVSYGWGPLVQLFKSGFSAWGSLKGYQSLRAFVRPKDFEEELVCPPLVSYDPLWKDTTKVTFPDERAEGTNITFECLGAMMMEGPEDAPMASKQYSGNATCVSVNGHLNWSYIPTFPCTFTCPPGYEEIPDRSVGVCLRFSMRPQNLVFCLLL